MQALIEHNIDIAPAQQISHHRQIGDLVVEKTRLWHVRVLRRHGRQIRRAGHDMEPVGQHGVAARARPQLDAVTTSPQSVGQDCGEAFLATGVGCGDGIAGRADDGDAHQIASLPSSARNEANPPSTRESIRPDVRTLV